MLDNPPSQTLIYFLRQFLLSQISLYNIDKTIKKIAKITRLTPRLWMVHKNGQWALVIIQNVLSVVDGVVIVSLVDILVLSIRIYCSVYLKEKVFNLTTQIYVAIIFINRNCLFIDFIFII